MITRADIDLRVAEWGLREDVVEKDYVLGWVLWGIGQDPTLRDAWIFKGGTCLKKCYLETYRFSEDLDFTVSPGGPLAPEEVAPLLDGLLARVAEESGIDFSIRPPRMRARPSGRTTEGRIYYRGPRSAPVAASIKLDLSGDEQLVRPPVLRAISHSYPDELPPDGTVRCYGFEEVFAEKLRALSERGRPRDLYDVVHLFRRPDLHSDPETIREVLSEKCSSKGVPVPTLETVLNSPHRAELEAEWANMLGHQLPALPPVEQFLEELTGLFQWLEGVAHPLVLAAVAHAADEATDWSPPSTVQTWGTHVPLEPIRFAAVNHLCVELGYGGDRRLIEPYSLRRTQAGNLVLHAIRVDGRGHRAYRVDKIESATVTSVPFTPVYAIEFTASGHLHAPPSSRATGSSRTARPSSGPVYAVACPVCGRRFRRRTREMNLRPHKDQNGWSCSGRRGYLVETDYI